jgi:hypothetical protein
MIKGERLHNNKHAVVVAITTSTVECTASSRLPHNFLHLPPRQSEDIWLLVQKKMKQQRARQKGRAVGSPVELFVAYTVLDRPAVSG